MPYSLHATTTAYLRLVKLHKTPYEVSVLGKNVIVYPNVMSPKYDWSSEFMVRHFPDLSGKSFLEIGCGCGVLSVFAGLQGAETITSVDINPSAIENTNTNFTIHNLKNAQSFYSDVFSGVHGVFDVICFNAPYHGTKPKDILEYGVSDPDYRALRLFFSNAARYLTDNGCIILGFSNTGDQELLRSLIIENKYHVTNSHKEARDGWTAYLLILKRIPPQNIVQSFIYADDYECFKIYKPFISQGSVLKIGNGLGYATSFIQLINPNTAVLDITVRPHSINNNSVKLYDGITIPYPDLSFDTVVCAYTLHHAQDPKRIFSEMARVTKSRIIIIEETYENLFQKCDLVWNCWKTNLQASQSVRIHWNSYFHAKKIRDLFENYDLKIVGSFSEPRRSFRVEGWILEK